MTDLETQLRAALADAADAVAPNPQAWTNLQRRSARPRRNRVTVGLSVVGAAIATAGVLTAVILGFSDSGAKPAPNSIDGVERDLTPTRELGPLALHNAAEILQSRLEAVGVHHPTVIPDNGFLRAYVPASSLSALTAVAATKGVLRFRQAVAISPGDPGGHGRPTPAAVTYAPTLSKQLQRTFATWPCQESVNPTRGREPASDYMVACSANGNTKYLLAPTSVPGHDITSATAGLDPQIGSQWVVTLNFNPAGAGAWLRVTARAYQVNGGRPSTRCAPPEGCNAVAITLDGVVESAPYISQSGGIAGGRAEISGRFTQATAGRLAAILNYGALPATFAVRKPAATR